VPSRPHTPSRPSIYLDTSTLVYAVKSAQVGTSESRAGARELFSLVGSVSRRDNLAFSIFHLLELSADGDQDAVRATLAWLDGLPLVWVRPLERIHDDEDEHWLKIVAGCPNPKPVEPFAPSMLAAFDGISVTESYQFLRAATLPAVFDEIRHAPNLTTRISDRASRTAAAFNANRAAFVPPGTPDTEVLRHQGSAHQRHRTDLRRRALQAHERLIARADPEYEPLKARLNDVVVPFSDLFFSTPTSFPLVQIEAAMNRGFIEAAVARTPGSRGFNRLESSFADSFHAQAAAYCDVFTCDILTSKWLGDQRRMLGLQPPVVFQGADFPRLVTDLTSAIESAQR
jgi:hypothetical protein